MENVTAVLLRNCRRDLHRCLSALSRGDYVYEVIVVDDGSDDGTQQMIKETGGRRSLFFRSARIPVMPYSQRGASGGAHTIRFSHPAGSAAGQKVSTGC